MKNEKEEESETLKEADTAELKVEFVLWGNTAEPDITYETAKSELSSIGQEVLKELVERLMRDVLKDRKNNPLKPSMAQTEQPVYKGLVIQDDNAELGTMPVDYVWKFLAELNDRFPDYFTHVYIFTVEGGD